MNGYIRIAHPPFSLTTESTICISMHDMEVLCIATIGNIQAAVCFYWLY
jgi:hypothetical protein